MAGKNNATNVKVSQTVTDVSRMLSLIESFGSVRCLRLHSALELEPSRPKALW